MKVFITLIVLLAVAGFGGKFYLEKKYESELDKAIAFTGAFANIGYEKVEIGFDSSIAVTGIRITPAQYDDTITIDSLIFSSSDPMMPIKGGDIFKDGEFPESFEVKLKRLAFDARSFDKLNKEPECRSATGALKYSNAGYERYDGDMRFKMDFSNVYASKIIIDAFDQAATTEIEITMDASEVVNSVTLNEPLPITDILVATELNQNAASSFADYCAGLFKVSADSYLDKVVGSKKFSENTLGVDLGPDFRKAMSKYMRGGSRFVLQATPSDSLKDISKARFFKPNDVINLLNATLSLDGVKVPMKVPELTAAEQKAVDEKDKAKGPKKKIYVSVPAVRAREYIGNRVRIKRKGDKPSIKGRMSGFEKNRIAVDVYRHAGEMTLNVPVNDVSKFEVLQ